MSIFALTLAMTSCGGELPEEIEDDEESALFPEATPPVEDHKSDAWGGDIKVGDTVRGYVSSYQERDLYAYAPRSANDRILLKVSQHDYLKFQPVIEVWRRPLGLYKPYRLQTRIIGTARNPPGFNVNLPVSVPQYGSYYIVVVRSAAPTGKRIPSGEYKLEVVSQ